MGNIIHIFSYPFLTAFTLTAIITPLTIKLFRNRRWLDDPRRQRVNVTHLYPVPRGGGLPIAIGVFAAILLFLPIDPKVIAILAAVSINLGVGLADDIYNLNPYLRLATNTLAAICLVLVGIKITFITNPFLPHQVLLLNQSWLSVSLGDILTIIWFVWMTNVVGWAGGIEGQLPGLVSIAAVTIGILGIRFSQDLTQWPLIGLAGAISGAYLGFLPYNFYPQQIMPGYSGKSIAGLLLGILAVLSGAKLATAILVLGIPMADGILAISRRLWRGQSPVWGDAEYLHHLLFRLGLPRTKIAILYWLFSLILGILVLNLNSRQKIYAFLLVFVVLVAFSLFLKRLLAQRATSP